ncbi:MBL fold metallo-hydrolase [Kocuria palustris]|uniref:MBL fold metallo-hydrolase n=1 Tax=Kocuria palustris TaxID=71999 RepID=UPI00119EBBB6|nr:MBL fold metallo-hydrolase [Kocuria palustris]
MSTLSEVGDDVHVITTENWRLNSGLVVGSSRALVIDTGAGPRQGQEILEAVRSVTDLPLIVLNTHAHYDHFMGNAVFERAGVTEFWSHRDAAAAIGAHGDYQRSFVGVLEPEMGEGKGLGTRLVVPQRHLPGTGLRPALSRIDLGGRQVVVFSMGRAHTDNDVLAGVDEVLFAGDVVEQGADPAFDDSYPREWVRALEQLADLERYAVIVPGHGSPVTRPAVREMAATMASAIRRLESPPVPERPGQASAAGPVTAALYQLPYGAAASRILLDRLSVIDAADASRAPTGAPRTD